jgi:lipopolysaccharide biosynthesis regulator YciM
MRELVWLLVPLAAYGGWFAARRSARVKEERQRDFPGPEYLKGLDYLLNEQPDKAIDVFVRMLEVGADTFDTHLALGNLFRRRGETDRAIRIHHNLAAQSSLGQKQRDEALLELGRDYQSAGLLDRAEEYYTALLNERNHVEDVLPRLLDVYQQENDWRRAFDTAGQMDRIDGRPAQAVRAQFLCEMAADARERGDADGARELLARALDFHAS